MSYTPAGTDITISQLARFRRSWPDAARFLQRTLSGEKAETSALIFGLWFVPVSIAVSQAFLSIGLVLHAVKRIRGAPSVPMPRVLRLWFIWAGAAVLVWAASEKPAAGWSEIRHLVMFGALIAIFPTLRRGKDRRAAWLGMFVSSTVSSLVLIGDFVRRFTIYRHEIAAGGDAAFYLRSGGLLHHWMVYGTVEVIIAAGLIAFWATQKVRPSGWWLVAGISGAAIALSLTRMVWLTCVLLIVVEGIRRRSQWIFALPVAAAVLYAAAPSAIGFRIAQSLDFHYYSNSERLQMLRVGWRMVRAHPLTGVGPGRVDDLYTSYLDPGDPIPAYHGHLHNNIAQIAAQFGLPVAFLAGLFVAILYWRLYQAWRASSNPEDRFVRYAALLGLTGFLFAGLFEYTYGHSLGLILIGFIVVSALQPADSAEAETSAIRAAGA